jgi:hypothetical protein
VRPRSRLFALSLAGVAASALPGCGFGHYEMTPAVDCERMPSTPSLRAAWRDGDDAEAAASRRKVAAFVVDCGAVRGMSRKAVRRMLGPVDEADRREMSFYLGPDNLQMDSEYLSVMFDGRGRAVDAQAYQG